MSRENPYMSRNKKLKHEEIVLIVEFLKSLTSDDVRSGVLLEHIPFNVPSGLEID